MQNERKKRTSVRRTISCVAMKGISPTINEAWNKATQLYYTTQSSLSAEKKNVDFHPSWTFVWRSEEFTKLGDPRSLIPTSDDRSGKTLGAKKAKNCSRYLILAWTWFIAIVILHNRKGLTAHERNISDKKSSLWPGLDLSAKNFSPFWFFLEYLLSDLEEVGDIIRFSHSSSKTKVWFNDEFLH